MASSDCVPVQVALNLMDTSTLGKADREPDFLNVHESIQDTLKAIVNGVYTAKYWRASNANRTSPGIQQLHWYISQDPVEHTELAGSRTEP